MDLEHETLKTGSLETLLIKNETHDFDSTYLQTHEMTSNQASLQGQKIKGQKKSKKGD